MVEKLSCQTTVSLTHARDVKQEEDMQYAEDSQHKKDMSTADYSAIPQCKRAVARASYAANQDQRGLQPKHNMQ